MNFKNLQQEITKYSKYKDLNETKKKYFSKISMKKS